MRDRIRNILFEATAFKDRSNTNDAFWKWFGSSKVVDDNGDPLVVYHGTAYLENGCDFTSITTDNVCASEGFLGAYFTQDTNVANLFAGGADDASRVFPAYLSIKNPFDVRGMKENELGAFLGRFVGSDLKEDLSEESQYAILEYFNGFHNLVPMIRKKKYDGIVFDDEGVTWVAFKHGQIKSVFNRGTWNPRSTDIME